MSQTGARPASTATAEADQRRYYHHGRSPAAWTGSISAIVAAFVGFFAFVPSLNPTIGMVAGGILAVGLIAAVLLRVLGLGQGSRKR